jgi:hypothetical protein
MRSSYIRSSRVGLQIEEAVAKTTRSAIGRKSRPASASCHLFQTVWFPRFFSPHQYTTTAGRHINLILQRSKSQYLLSEVTPSLSNMLVRYSKGHKNLLLLRHAALEVPSSLLKSFVALNTHSFAQSLNLGPNQYCHMSMVESFLAVHY